MVNLHICSTFLPGILNIRWCYLITEDLDFFGNLKQSPEFVRNFSRSKVLFDIIDNTQIPIQIVRNSSSMRSVTKMTLILIGYPGGDHLAFSSGQDRKSTRLNSSHVASSYAVFCLKKKTIKWIQRVPSPVKRREDSDMVHYREIAEALYGGIQFIDGKTGG